MSISKSKTSRKSSLQGFWAVRFINMKEWQMEAG